MVIFVIGVSGCGKSTIAEKLSKETGIPYFDADDFHPQANIEKMSRACRNHKGPASIMIFLIMKL